MSVHRSTSWLGDSVAVHEKVGSAVGLAGVGGTVTVEAGPGQPHDSEKGGSAHILRGGGGATLAIIVGVLVVGGGGGKGGGHLDSHRRLHLRHDTRARRVQPSQDNFLLRQAEA